MTLLATLLLIPACGDTVETEETKEPDDSACYDPCIDKGGTEEECSAFCDDYDKDTAECVAACTEKGETEEVCTAYCEGDKGDKSDDLSTYDTFEHDGLTRHYLFYAPADLPANAPLVVYLHGAGGYAGEAQGRVGLDAIADEHGFAVCYAQGSLNEDGVSHWNPLVEDTKVDDVGYLSSLVASLQAEHGLDPTRTFAAGFSAGGYMTYVLAMEAPEAFHGAASFAGHMSGGAWDARDNGSATFPLLQLSGLDDEQVPIEGGGESKAGWGGAPHMDTIIDYWKDKNTCASSETDNVNANASRDRHLDCIDDHEIWYYKVAGFGHDWPTAKNSAGIEGAELIWDFFGRF